MLHDLKRSLSKFRSCKVTCCGNHDVQVREMIFSCHIKNEDLHGKSQGLFCVHDVIKFKSSSNISVIGAPQVR